MARPLIFFHRMTRNLFGGFLLRRLLTDFRGCDLFGRCRYPLRVEYIPQISQIYTDFFHGFFCHADFADDADFFLIGFFYSSDDTEFIRRFLATAITHGFSRMRPVRSLQIPPESGICPTDLHRLSLLQFHSLPSLFSLLISHFSFAISHFIVFLICHLLVISHLSFVISHFIVFLICHFSFVIKYAPAKK